MIHTKSFISGGVFAWDLYTINPNPIGGGAFMAPPVIFFAVHLDRLEFCVQTSWLFSLKSPAYFDI